MKAVVDPEFSVGVGANLVRGVCQNERIGTLRGRASGTPPPPPLDSPRERIPCSSIPGEKNCMKAWKQIPKMINDSMVRFVVLLILLRLLLQVTLFQIVMLHVCFSEIKVLSKIKCMFCVKNAVHTISIQFSAQFHW